MGCKSFKKVKQRYLLQCLSISNQFSEDFFKRNLIFNNRNPFFEVCESKSREYNISNDKPNCQIVTQTVCFNETFAGEECRNVTRTECSIDASQKTTSFPETEVNFKENLKKKHFNGAKRQF